MSFRLSFLLNYVAKVILEVLGMFVFELGSFGVILGKVLRIEMVKFLGSKGRVAALF